MGALEDMGGRLASMARAGIEHGGQEDVSTLLCASARRNDFSFCSSFNDLLFGTVARYS